MCVLRIEDSGKNYRFELIDRDLEPQFDTMKKTLNSLDAARRSKFLFLLTMWKSRKVELNRIDFREGLSYRFEKAHSLRLLYGNPTGSMQIRDRLRAEPLTVQTDDTNREIGELETVSDGNIVQHMSSVDTVVVGATVSETPPRECTGASEVATPVVKSSAKRKIRKNEGDEQTLKRIRKVIEKMPE
ncbi:hypothetical protein PHMEG_00035833 [Phytophthora megakarya]|uniref:Uncharacterized protein n=1 Tax=Phytophthora megakarya TaxID=4795 RepID=A0A225UPF7_9STRA|nr:hypothetical protein PHMEG_00035833 [Phytophthora megakarya]